MKKREITFASMLLGIALAVVFGAANAYLGLRVGLTVSASIPAAVISMGVYRYVIRREALLESNMVQTIGSAGESLAAGMIFTAPVLFMWAKEGMGMPPDSWTLTLIALAGGMLGTLFMIPLRRAIVAREDAELKFPEGAACADILKSGQKGAEGSGKVFGGMGVAFLLQFALAGLKLAPSSLMVPVNFIRGAIGLDFSPALAGVGYIVGPRIASVLFAGSFLGWMVLVPLLVWLGGDAVAFDYAAGGAQAVWSHHLRYIGAGAIATGGFISLAKNLPLFVRAFRDVMRDTRRGAAGDGTSDLPGDLPGWTLPVGIVAVLLIVALTPSVECGFGGALLVALFGFFFAAVSARMVAVVGSSNNPVSGMTIATLVVATLVLKVAGVAGAVGMVSAMFIGSIVCVIASMAGDTAQDLRTGWLLGATPWKQQLGELVGALAASISIGAVMYLLDRAWGFGSAEIPAPQANLMKLVVEGIMGGTLPWGYLGIGAVLAAALAFTKIPVMPFAIGLYLPVGLNTMIFLGGIIRRFSRDAAGGTLFSAGLVAGEGLCGLFLALAALANLPLALPFSLGFPGAAALLVLLLCMMRKI